jgi:hypothetical protein
MFFKLVVFVLPMAVIFFLKIDYNSIDNLDDILLGSIAFSSSSLGFFIAGVSILQTSNLSRYYKKLTDLGTDKKIISWLFTAIAYMFMLSSLSLILLFFVADIIKPVEILFSIWLSFLCAATISTLFIILIFGYVFTK